MQGYLSDVQEFEGFLGLVGVPLEETKEQHVKEYILSLRETGKSNFTIARKNSSLRLYFKFLRKQNRMIHNPMDDIRQPKLEEKVVVISEEDIDCLLQSVASDDWRLQVILGLLIFDSLKPSEIIGLEEHSFNAEQGILYTHKRAVVLHEKTRQMLLSRKVQFPLKNHRGAPLSEAGLYFIVRAHLDQTGFTHLRPIDLSK